MRVLGRVKDAIKEHTAERNTLTRWQRYGCARVRRQLTTVGQSHSNELDTSCRIRCV